MTERHAYDLSEYPFPDVMRAMLGVEDLSRLEASVRPEDGWSIYKTMEREPLYNRLQAALLGNAGADFRDLYRRFVAERIRPGFDRPILYQACPTVRLLFADAGGEARFHRDRDYGHDAAEINYTVALTPMQATNAIWIESAADAGDFAPIELQPGEYSRFDGASLRHGAVLNETGRSRVSFDFRVVPEALRSGQHLTERLLPEELNAHVFARCP